MTEESQFECRKQQTSFLESQGRFCSPLSWQRGRRMVVDVLALIYARDWTATDGGIHSHTQLREEVLGTGLRKTIVHILIS